MTDAELRALIARLRDARNRVSDMAAEGRGPRMSIPVRDTDDDIAICSAIDDTVNALPGLLDRLAAAEADAARLRLDLNEMMLVVEDFMPNIGRCAIQNYARLNTAMIAGAANRTVLDAAREAGK